MEKTILNKLIRKKAIWATIKAKEQEYNRVQSQIKLLEQQKADISFEVQKLLQESQELAEYIDGHSYKLNNPTP